MNSTALGISRFPRPEPVSKPIDEPLETSRLKLRAPDEQDIIAMTALADNPRVAARLWSMPHPYTISDAGRFLRRVRDRNDGLTAVAVTLRETGAFIGSVKFEAGDDEAERTIGFWLGEPHWKRGFMTEAVQVMVDSEFSQSPRLARISAAVHVNDRAARRVLEKCGFQYAGPSAETDLKHGGMVPVDHYAIDRGIWRALRAWSSRHPTGDAAASPKASAAQTNGNLRKPAITAIAAS